MCSQMEAEPGPPLKAKVRDASRIFVSMRVSDVEHQRVDLAGLVFNRQTSGGGGVAEQLARRRGFRDG